MTNPVEKIQYAESDQERKLHFERKKKFLTAGLEEFLKRYPSKTKKKEVMGHYTNLQRLEAMLKRNKEEWTALEWDDLSDMILGVFLEQWGVEKDESGKTNWEKYLNG